MKKLLFSLSLLGLAGAAGTACAADLAVAPAPRAAPVGVVFPPVVAQLGPATTYSSIVCENYAKLPDGAWKALNPTEFGLGYVMHIVPPVLPIKSGGFIYNNIDLYSQLETQCGGTLVRARY